MNRRLTPPRWGPSDIERQASGAHPAPLRDRLHRGSKRGPSPLPSLMSTRSPSHGARPGAPGCRSDPLLSPRSRRCAGLSPAPWLLYAASETRRHTSGCHFICSFSAAKNANGAGQTAPSRLSPPPH